MQSFWYECTECNKGNHIRIDEGMSSILAVYGAPGPEWKRIERERVKELSFRVDPAFLHVWVAQQHFEIEARK